MRSLLDFGSGINYGFRPFSIGYEDDPVMILADTAVFLSVPVAEICGTPPVPGTISFGGNSLEYTKDPPDETINLGSFSCIASDCATYGFPLILSNRAQILPTDSLKYPPEIFFYKKKKARFLKNLKTTSAI